MKTIFSIKEVFEKISVDGNLIELDGQQVKVTKNLKRLHHKGLAQMECCLCGCIGTHIQAFSVPYNKDEETVVYRVMAWNKKHQCQTYLNLDHILPASKGGTWHPQNLRVTCYECNNQRGNEYICESQFGGVNSTREYVKFKDALNLINNNAQLKKGQYDMIKSSLSHRLHSTNSNMPFKRIPKDLMISVVQKSAEKLKIELNTKFYDELQTIAYA